MAFGLGERYARPSGREPVRAQTEIACDCWFTSQGRAIPRMIKFPDEGGELRTVRDIRVLTAESKRYSGIVCVEYDCEMEIRGVRHRVCLIFYPETCRWVMCRPAEDSL